MKVLTAAAMQACDRLTTERFGQPSIDLMREASAAVAAFARQQFPGARRITVLCGGGNNGGDGMMAARLLTLAGLEVTTLLLGASEGLKGDAAQAWRELNAAPHGPIHQMREAGEEAQFAHALQTDLIVDAVLGTGFKPPLRGLALDFCQALQGSAVPVLAVDLPSGWPADYSGAQAPSRVFPADAVITFTAPKPAHLFGHLTRRWNQPVALASIGSPPSALVAAEAEDPAGLHWAGASLALLEAPRAWAANKGSFGHVLVVGGSVGKSGAAAIASLGALRAGAGLVTAAVPASVLPLVAAVAPELMCFPLSATADGQIAAENLAPQRLEALLAKKSVLAIGPGLGQSDAAARFALELLAQTKLPAVVDADALNLLAARPDLLAKAAKDRTLVLTPHPGEMARLAGVTLAKVQAHRLETARRFAQRFGVILVLKGARTLIARPDGSVAVNTTGNPGMAKGGSGDLLAGMLAALLAQHPDQPANAAEAAVCLHGLAADLAVRTIDEHSLLATDTLQFLSQAFRFRFAGPNGYLWLQGLPPELPAAAPSDEEANEQHSPSRSPSH